MGTLCLGPHPQAPHYNDCGELLETSQARHALLVLSSATRPRHPSCHIRNIAGRQAEALHRSRDVPRRPTRLPCSLAEDCQEDLGRPINDGRSPSCPERTRVTKAKGNNLQSKGNSDPKARIHPGGVRAGTRSLRCASEGVDLLLSIISCQPVPPLQASRTRSEHYRRKGRSRSRMVRCPSPIPQLPVLQHPWNTSRTPPIRLPESRRLAPRACRTTLRAHHRPGTGERQ